MPSQYHLPSSGSWWKAFWSQQSSRLPPKFLFHTLVWIWDFCHSCLVTLLPADVRLSRQVCGFFLSEAISCFTRLGVADTLKDGPRDIHGIAERLEGPVDKENLLRLLKFVTANGLFSCDKKGRFGLTSMSNLLCEGPSSLAPMVLLLNGPDDHRVGWSNLEIAVRKGGNAFEQVTGKSLWDYYDSKPELSKKADLAFTSALNVEGEPLVQDFDWSFFRSIVDVGGGEGHLLVEILKSWPSLRGHVTVFDRTTVIKGGTTKEASEMGINFQEGNFFDKVEPAGQDAYVLKHILHDWSDAQSVAILKRVKEAMGGAQTANVKARALIIDVVFEGEDDPFYMYKTAMDVNMMAMCPGKERTASEWKRILNESGFSIVKFHKIRSISSVIEAKITEG